MLYTINKQTNEFNSTVILFRASCHACIHQRLLNFDLNKFKSMLNNWF